MPTGIRTAQLNRMRTAAQVMMQSRANVSGMRGSPRAQQPVYTAMPCRYDPDAPGGNPLVEIQNSPTSGTLYFPYNYTLEENDTVVLDSGTYNVLKANSDGTPVIQLMARLEKSKGK